MLQGLDAAGEDGVCWHVVSAMDPQGCSLERTSVPHAPWFPIPCDQKWFRNLAVAQVLVEAMDAMDQRYPKPTVDLDQIRREYHATAAPEHAKTKQGRR